MRFVEQKEKKIKVEKDSKMHKKNTAAHTGRAIDTAEESSEKKDKSETGQDVKQLRHSLVIAASGLLILLAVAIGFTYAWFSLSGRAATNVTPMGGTVSDGDTSLLISASASGPFDKTCELVYAGNPDSLLPVTTSDLEHFYKVTTQDKKGIAVLYGNADERVDQDILHGTVYLKCENASCNVYFNQAELKLGSDAQALAAMRFGMKITSRSGSQTYIFRLDELGATGSAQSVRTVPQDGTVVASVDGSGQPQYTSDPSVGLSDYMAQDGSGSNSFQGGSKELVKLEADEVATVEYWLYLEGCDDQCSNPVQNINSDVQLAFAGTSARQ